MSGERNKSREIKNNYPELLKKRQNEAERRKLLIDRIFKIEAQIHRVAMRGY